MKAQIRTIFILLLSFILIYLVIRQVGLSELIEVLRGANVYWLMVSILLSPFLILVSSIKWQVLLRSQNINIALSRLFALYLVGRFFNYFLPTNVGGDVVRAYELSNYTNKGAQSWASVFMERFTGFIVLVLFAVVSAIANYQILLEAGLVPIVLLAVIVLLGVMWLVLDSRPLALLSRLVTFQFGKKYIRKLEKFHHSLQAYRYQQKTIGIAILWSIVFMILAILNVYTSAMAFYQPVSLAEITVIVPLILVISMFPITINGLGIQEWAYVFLFSRLGMPAAIGLSTILLIRAKDILFAIIGGILYPMLKIRDEHIPLGELDPEELK